MQDDGVAQSHALIEAELETWQSNGGIGFQNVEGCNTIVGINGDIGIFRSQGNRSSTLSGINTCIFEDDT